MQIDDFRWKVVDLIVLDHERHRVVQSHGGEGLGKSLASRHINPYKNIEEAGGGKKFLWWRVGASLRLHLAGADPFGRPRFCGRAVVPLAGPHIRWSGRGVRGARGISAREKERFDLRVDLGSVQAGGAGRYAFTRESGRLDQHAFAYIDWHDNVNRYSNRYTIHIRVAAIWQRRTASDQGLWIEKRWTG